ncbi:MAG TPA: hypothetical protein VMM13_04605 [Euzebya sp.]|nr:hypothetical protein [Euzebya sp.]
MANPQQPELRRSEKTPHLTPDAIQGELEAKDRPDSAGKTGPVPKANKPGSGSGPVQDKPDLDDFAAKLGTDSAAGGKPAAKASATAKGKPAVKTPATAKGKPPVKTQAASPREAVTANSQPASAKTTPPAKAPASLFATAPRSAGPVKTGTARIEGSAVTTPPQDDRDLIPKPLLVATKLVVGTAGIAAGAVRIATLPVRRVARYVVGSLTGRD